MASFTWGRSQACEFQALILPHKLHALESHYSWRLWSLARLPTLTAPPPEGPKLTLVAGQRAGSVRDMIESLPEPIAFRHSPGVLCASHQSSSLLPAVR
jgi:hypothetical protein